MPAPGELSLDALVNTDVDELDRRETKQFVRDVASAQNRLDAVHAAAIARLDGGGWHLDDGLLTTKSWLAHDSHVSGAVAGSRVHLAKRLGRLPLMAEALAAGTVTFAHARSMARYLTPRTLAELARDEEMLVDKAISLEADDFDVCITRWLRLNDPDGPDPATGEPSTLSASRHFQGRVRIDGDLDVEDDTEFLAELEARVDQLWREAADDSDPNKHRTPAQRNAAALVEMARRSSAADRDDGDDPDQVDDDDVDDPAPNIARRPRSRLIMVLADLHALEKHPDGLAELEDGTLLPVPVLERWLCDAGIARVVMAGPLVPVDLGRAARASSAAQRRALAARDRGCIIPGCKRKPRWCQAHHVRPWEAGGPTDMGNLVLVCHRHHKLIHDKVITL